MALTKEQALALASARLRLKSRNTDVPELEEAPFMAQVGRGMMDVYQGGKQLGLEAGEKLGLVDPRTVEEYNKQLQEELALYERANPDFQFGRLAGNIATPLTLIPGTSTVKGLAGIGAVGGALQPVTGEDYWTQKAFQTGTGAVLAPVVGKIPAGLGKAKEGAQRFLRPISKTGPQQEIRDVLREQLGDQQARVVEALMRAQPDETSAQAVARQALVSGEDFGAAIPRFEKELSKVSEAGQGLRSQYGQQQAGREKVIQAIAGTDDDLARAMEARGAVDYPRAFAQQVDIPQPYNPYRMTVKGESVAQVAKGDPELSKMVNNPYFKDAMNKANKLAESEGFKFKDNPTKYLHNIKLALDDKLEGVGEKAIEKSEREAVRSLKTRLVDWIQEKNPTYRDVREEFIEKSKPIDVMNIGREYQTRLTRPTGDEAAGTFLKAVEDVPKTLKSATGRQFYKTLEETPLTPEQIGGVQKVAGELERNLQAKRMAGSVEGVLPKLKERITPQLPNPLLRPVMLANSLLRRISSRKEPEYQKMAAELMQNPQMLAELLQGPAPSRANKVMYEIYQDIIPLMSAQIAAREEGK